MRIISKGRVLEALKDLEKRIPYRNDIKYLRDPENGYSMAIAEMEDIIKAEPEIEEARIYTECDYWDLMSVKFDHEEVDENGHTMTAGYYGFVDAVCSRCGKCWTMPGPNTGHWMKFCPSCGEKMRGFKIYPPRRNKSEASNGNEA